MPQREKAIHDFEARAVATHSDEIAIAFCIRAVREHDSFAGRASFAHSISKPARGVFQAPPEQASRNAHSPPLDSRWRSSARSQGNRALRSSCLPICSARTMRLIFKPALRGSRAPRHVCRDSLVIQKLCITAGNFRAQCAICVLPRLGMEHQHELLAGHRVLWPNVVRREDGKFLHGKPSNVFSYLPDKYFSLPA